MQAASRLMLLSPLLSPLLSHFSLDGALFSVPGYQFGAEPQLTLLMQGKQSAYQTSFSPSTLQLVRLLSLMHLTLSAMPGNLDVSDTEKGDGARVVLIEGSHLLDVC